MHVTQEPKRGITLPRHRAITTLVVSLALVAGTLSVGAGVGAAAKTTSRSTGTDAAEVFAEPATPDLIQAAVDDGEITEAQGALFLSYAFTAPDEVPEAYQSTTPWSGTLPLLDLQQTLQELGSAPAAAEARSQLRQLRGGNFGCPGVKKALPNRKIAGNFYVQYDAKKLKSPKIGTFVSALKKTWKVEIQQYKWARPPKDPKKNPPGGRYAVKIADLGEGLYGYVAASRAVKDNPNVPWKVKHAYASCMVLNQDFSQFPGTPKHAMQATVAHEFNHSIQFGYGALAGALQAAGSFVEGGATWMEGEVFPKSRDNFNYLWPAIKKPMVQYVPGFPYPYWIVFRAMLERFGTSKPGGGQTVFRRFWEEISKRKGTNLDAMDKALVQRGTSLPEAFHDASVAIRFYSLGCQGVTVERKFCLKEGPLYPNGWDTPGNTFTIESPTGTLNKKVANDFATVNVGIPSDTYADIVVSVTGGQGTLRTSLACRTGNTSLTVQTGTDINEGESQSFGSKNLSSCDAGQAVLVISNIHWGTSSPKAIIQTDFQVQLTTPA